MDILPQLLVNALISGSIYAIAASGLALTYGLMKILNFAHGHFLMLGAYSFYLIRVWGEQGLLTTSLVSIFSMAVVGAVSYLLVVKPFLRFSPLLPFVTTLALGSFLEAIISLICGVNVQSISQGISIQSHHYAGVYITNLQLIIIFSTCGVLGIVALVVHATGVGRRIRALSEDPYAAQALGINNSAIVGSVFIVSALLAGYAGILVGLETSIQPTMGSSYTIKAFAAMVLGGLGNIWGTVLGSYLLSLIENLSIGLDFGAYSLPAGYKDAFAFLIILLILLWRPEGLFRRKARAV